MSTPDETPPASPPSMMDLTREAEEIAKEIHNIDAYIKGIPHGFIPKARQPRARWDARKKRKAMIRRLDEIRIVALKEGWIKPPQPDTPPRNPLDSAHGA